MNVPRRRTPIVWERPQSGHVAESLRRIASRRMRAGVLIDREVDIERAAEAYAAIRSNSPPIGTLPRYPFAERAA